MTANALALTGAAGAHARKHTFEQTQEYVTMRLGDQLFGIPVLAVQDVLRIQNVAKIPLARREIAGLMNLRGRIVTVIDLRARLGLAPYVSMETNGMNGRPRRNSQMNVVVEYNDELYSLLVDSVGDVMALPLDKFENSPANLSAAWREVSTGIFRLKGELLVVIDVQHLLKL